MHVRHLAAIGVAWLVFFPAVETRAASDPATSPALRAEHGWRIEPFEAGPEMACPVALAFDARGRAWVAELADLPSQGRDRVVIYEDADGDGVADRRVVFAEGLDRPSGLAFGGGGLIVACAPDILLLRDSDGDGVADRRTRLLTGFARGDLASAPGSLRYGPDNWIWGRVGRGGGTVSAGEPARTFGRAIFRFRPDGSAFEVVGSLAEEPTGLGFDEWGEVFASAASGAPIVFLALPDRTIARVRGWRARGCGPIVGPDSKPCATGGLTGLAVVTVPGESTSPWPAGSLSAVACDAAGHAVHRVRLGRAGAGFAARSCVDVVRGDASFLPREAVPGPDGAIWIVDSAAAAGAREGGARGRLWRLIPPGSADAARPPARPRLDRDRPDELIAALGHPGAFWRLSAQRLLVERGGLDVQLALARIVTHDAEGTAALHALWTLDGLGSLSDGVAFWKQATRMALLHPNPAVRRATLRVIPRTREAAAAIMEDCLFIDDEPAVRLEAMLALAEMPGAGRAASRLVMALEGRPELQDSWLDAGAIAAMASHGGEFLMALSSGQIRPESRARIEDMVRTVATHWAAGAPREAVAPVITALNAADPVVVEATLAGLLAGWPEDKAKNPPPGRLDADFLIQMKRLPPEDRPLVLALAVRWNVQGAFLGELMRQREQALRRLAGPRASDDDRMQCLRVLLALGERYAALDAGLATLAPTASPPLMGRAVDEVSSLGPPGLGHRLMYNWFHQRSAARHTSMAVLLRRPDWAHSGLQGLESGLIRPRDLTLDHLCRLLDYPEASVSDRARAGFARSSRLIDPDRARVVADWNRIAATGAATDPARGPAVFRSHCAQCHRLRGEGVRIGPDLDRQAGRLRADLLTDVLDPNRSVAEDGRRASLLTTDGRVLVGLLRADRPDAAEFVDDFGQTLTIPRAKIKSLDVSRRSLMPEGFELMPREDLAALLTYLTATTQARSDQGREAPRRVSVQIVQP